MNISLTIAATALLAGFTGNFSPLLAQTKPPSAAAACAPMGGVSFVCGARNPEDLVLIPGTRWLIASGMEAGAGLKLIDTNAKTARPFYTGELSQQHPDKKLFANCPAPPDAKRFNAHGIYLRRVRAPGHYMLYVVSHGALKSIEVFDVDASGVEPSLTWTECVPMPEGNKAYANLGDQANSRRLAANAVAAFSDGTIIATVPQRPGTTNKQRLNGGATGDVVAVPVKLT